ncbi:MAG: hypothetical protein QW717_01870 [Candidatus Bathyarchaeia archaeon]
MSGKKQYGVNLDSKFWKTLLTLAAVVLIFAGPTYAVLVLFRALDFDYALSMASGFVLFAAGLMLLCFLVNRKVIS